MYYVSYVLKPKRIGRAGSRHTNLICCTAYSLVWRKQNVSLLFAEAGIAVEDNEPVSKH